MSSRKWTLQYRLRSRAYVNVHPSPRLEVFFHHAHTMSSSNSIWRPHVDLRSLDPAARLQAAQHTTTRLLAQLPVIPANKLPLIAAQLLKVFNACQSLSSLTAGASGRQWWFLAESGAPFEVFRAMVQDLLVQWQGVHARYHRPNLGFDICREGVQPIRREGIDDLERGLERNPLAALSRLMISPPRRGLSSGKEEGDNGREGRESRAQGGSEQAHADDQQMRENKEARKQGHAPEEGLQAETTFDAGEHGDLETSQQASDDGGSWDGIGMSGLEDDYAAQDDIDAAPPRTLVLSGIVEVTSLVERSLDTTDESCPPFEGANRAFDLIGHALDYEAQLIETHVYDYVASPAFLAGTPEIGEEIRRMVRRLAAGKPLLVKHLAFVAQAMQRVFVVLFNGNLINLRSYVPVDIGTRVDLLADAIAIAIPSNGSSEDDELPWYCEALIPGSRLPPHSFAPWGRTQGRLLAAPTHGTIHDQYGFWAREDSDRPCGCEEET